MRHTLIVLLLLLAPAVHHASAAAVGANPAEDAFNSVYSADVQQVKVSASGEFFRSVRPLPPLPQGPDGRYPEIRVASPPFPTFSVASPPFLVSGQCGLVSAAEPGSPIVLSATTVGLDNKDCKKVALGEPIWVRFTLENSSDVKVTTALPGEPGYGVRIEPVTKDGNVKSRAVEKRVLLERIIHGRHFEPKAKETFEVLLADWVDINGEGAVKLEAKLWLLDEKWRPAQELKTEFSITIKGQLDKKGLDALMKRVEALYSSKRDALDRYRALDSVRAIRAPEVLPFLAKAVADKGEPTQVLAVQSLSVLPYPEVIPLLKKAAESRFALVREAAQAELDRREKANPG